MTENGKRVVATAYRRAAARNRRRLPPDVLARYVSEFEVFDAVAVVKALRTAEAAKGGLPTPSDALDVLLGNGYGELG